MPGSATRCSPCRTSGPVAVAEAHVVELDAPLDARERQRARLVGELGLRVHDVEDPVERRRRREVGVVDQRELLHRVEEVRQVEHEREQRPDLHRALDRQVAAVDQDDRGADDREQLDEREVPGVQPDRAAVGLAVDLARPVERDGVVGIAIELLDHAHAGEVLGERRRDVGEPLAHHAVRTRRADAEDDRRRRHRREHDEDREREPPVEQHERHGGADQDQGVAQRRRDAVGDELLERVDVVRQARDDATRALALEVAELEALDVGEQVDAQVGEHAAADPRRRVRLHRHRRPADQHGEDERADPERERRAIVHQPVVRVDAAVDRPLGERRPGEVRADADEQAHDARDRAQAIGAHQPQETAVARPAAAGPAHVACSATRSPSRSMKVGTIASWFQISS